MVESSEPSERDRQPTEAELKASWHGAIDALLAYFDAVIICQLKAKSKRQPRPKRITLVRSALAGEIRISLVRTLGRIETELGKLYVKQTMRERFESAETVKRFSYRVVAVRRA